MIFEGYNPKTKQRFFTNSLGIKNTGKEMLTHNKDTFNRNVFNWYDHLTIFSGQTLDKDRLIVPDRHVLWTLLIDFAENDIETDDNFYRLTNQSCWFYPWPQFKAAGMQFEDLVVSYERLIRQHKDLFCIEGFEYKYFAKFISFFLKDLQKHSIGGYLEIGEYNDHDGNSGVIYLKSVCGEPIMVTLNVSTIAR